MKKLEPDLIRVLEIVFCICFLVMFALIVTQVALRYGFNESIGGANELATILFAYTSALGIAVGIAKRDHMAISWFTERLGPRLTKGHRRHRPGPAGAPQPASSSGTRSGGSTSPARG